MKFQLLTAALFSSAAIAQTVGGNSGLSFCEGYSAKSELNVKDFSFTPNAIKTGKTVMFTAKGETTGDTEITNGAKFEIKLHHSFVKRTFTQPICGAMEMECPSKKLDFRYAATIPKHAPDGDYDVEIKFKNGDGKVLSCAKGKINVD